MKGILFFRLSAVVGVLLDHSSSGLRQQILMSGFWRTGIWTQGVCRGSSVAPGGILPGYF